MIVCILGMHRAGTSLIARVVNLLGVYLGPEEHLMEPKKDNPAGFWEHQLVTALDDEILSRFGGAWDRPPDFPRGWERSVKIADLRRRARRIVLGDFRGAKLWGWKDPRTCLTLPFWQRLFPRMRYVICLRNPVDVAKSLGRREGFTLEKSADLWLCYMKSALEYTAGQPRLYVSYDDFVTNWREELSRLSDFIGRARQAKQPNVRKAVRRFVREDLQHHRTDLLNLMRERRIPYPTKALSTILTTYTSIKEGGTIRSRGHLELQDALSVFSQISASAQEEAQHLKSENARLAQDLTGMSTELTNTRTELAKTSTELTKAHAELTTVKGSFGYRLMRYSAMRIDRILPDNTSRGRLKRALVTVARAIDLT